MNDRASTARLAAAAALTFAALAATLIALACMPDPTGDQLQAVVTTLGVAIAVAMASVVGRAGQTR